MARNRSQIMIADDHAFVADACRKLLEPEFDVVATVGDGRALVRIAANLEPQVIIIDIGMPLLNCPTGPDAARNSDTVGCCVPTIGSQLPKINLRLPPKVAVFSVCPVNLSWKVNKECSRSTMFATESAN
jgi:CheY-like chemotaxis protein